jgi:hypothetical protein
LAKILGLMDSDRIWRDRNLNAISDESYDAIPHVHFASIAYQLEDKAK